MANGYALKKNAFRRWIYSNGYTQPRIARILGITVEELKRKLTEHEPFAEWQLRRLVYFMGAESAFRVIYFHSFSERERVKRSAFIKGESRNGNRKR